MINRNLCHFYCQNRGTKFKPAHWGYLCFAQHKSCRHWSILVCYSEMTNCSSRKFWRNTVDQKSLLFGTTTRGMRTFSNPGSFPAIHSTTRQNKDRHDHPQFFFTQNVSINALYVHKKYVLSIATLKILHRSFVVYLNKVKCLCRHFLATSTLFRLS